ncbi:MAG: hypothetical protein P4L36_14410 [Holophaga sp.]|nr:hypothetical protein [Holophaga sp.]
MAAWTPVELHNDMDRALHLFTHGAAGPLVVVRTSALDVVQPGLVFEAGEAVDLPLQPGESLMIRLLNEQVWATQSFSLFCADSNILSRLTIGGTGQPGALGWGVEAPLDPHPEAHRYDLVVFPSSQLVIQPPPVADDGPEAMANGEEGPAY